MPSMPREMSWLTPKRRRTTGNLRTTSNGRISNDTPRSSSGSGSPTLERPVTLHRHTISQPAASNATADGNLFYAYARKSDDLTSRYLLTFASAAVANEWWLLLQIHFPDTTRPGPQLFSFQTDDLLPKAWKHPSFAHLKSKWMYISFSDTSSDGLGGAAQGIIPVQDAHGNMLGGSASNANELMPEVKEEVSQEVKQGVGRLEESFGKMMEALQQNTKQAAALAARINAPEPSRDVATEEADDKAPATSGGYFDTEALSTHFGRLNELLTKNSKHVETLTKKHYDNEQKLRKTMDALASRQSDDSLNMQQLSSHLDRIQGMIEDSVKERKDSARELSERPPQIDFSPLTQRLEKVQEAVEQNSALIKLLLDEATSSPDPPKEQPAPQQDFTPWRELLERIHSALEQQSEHTKTLVDFASGDGEGEGAESGILGQDRNLAPLGEHLEQIYNAIEEGNKQARELQPKLDLEPLNQHFSVLREHSQKHNQNLEQIYNAMEEGNKYAREAQSKLDLGPLHEHFHSLREHADKHNGHLEAIYSAVDEGNKRALDSRPKLDLEPLNEHFNTMREHADKHSGYLVQIYNAVDEGNKRALESQRNVDFEPLDKQFGSLREYMEKHNDRLEQIHNAINEGNQRTQESQPKFDFEPLSEHFSSLREHAEKHNEHLERLLEAQNSTRDAVEANGGEIDFTPLTEYLEAIRESNEANAEATKSLLEWRSEEGSRNMDMTPLSSHLEAIRKATEQNAEHTQSLVESQQASATKSVESRDIDFTPLTDRLNGIHSTLEKQAEQQRDQSPNVGDAKFLMNALTSHLSKIQGITEQNATQVKSLREKQSSSTTKMEQAVTSTSEQLRSLAERNKQNEAKIDAQNSQMRELMSGQREMVDVMRQLARSVVAQNKGACDHVVVPPPRKMGRKVVGFVYDAKEGMG